MSTDEVATNKAAFTRFRDAMNTCDTQVISATLDELVAKDATIRTPVPGDATGAEKLKQVWAVLLRGLPDLQLDVKDLIGEGDKIVARIVCSGTHLGEYMGVAPTGKPIVYEEIFIFRFADGRVVETWGVVDVLAQMKQLGVVSA